MVMKLVVLDIDQTLIHARERQSSDKQHNFTIQMKAHNELYYIFKRRGLTQFIQLLIAMQKNYNLKIAIWTAAERTYAVKILDNIWQGWQQHLLFLRHRRHCTLHNGVLVKELRKIPGNYDIMLVDDNMDNFDLNTNHGFSVWKSVPYTYGSIDSELEKIQRFIYYTLKNRFPFPLKPKSFFLNLQRKSSNQSYFLQPIPKRT